MYEHFNVVTILLIIVSWILITVVVKDLYITVRRLYGNTGNVESFTYYSSSCSWIVRAVLEINKSLWWRRAFLSKVSLLVPIMQYLLWSVLLVSGFCFLYLALSWQVFGELSPANLLTGFLSALMMSLTIFTHTASHNINPDETLIYTVAAVQFYSSFIFHGLAAFYFLTLWRRAKRLAPALYRLKYELKKPYSPLLLSSSLRQYRMNALLLILQDWERWALEVGDDLKSCPPLIYSGSGMREGRSWLSSINIILDTTAVVIVTSDDSIKKQAKKTFGAARATLVEISNHLGLLPRGAKSSATAKELMAMYDDDVLSSEIIFEREEKGVTSKKIEMLELWRFTYQAPLLALADYLAVELPSRKTDKNNNNKVCVKEV